MTFLDEFKNSGINMSLQYYGAADLATGWEVKALIEHRELFLDFFEKHPLTAVTTKEDFYLFLFAEKLAAMRELLPRINEEYRDYCEKLFSEAEQAKSNISTGSIIQFLNFNIADAFDAPHEHYHVREIIFEYIQRYQNGIQDNAFKWVCTHYGYMVLERFEKLYWTFEKKPYLFDYVFPCGTYEEVDGLGFSKVLDIFAFIIRKSSSKLNETVQRVLISLYEEMNNRADNVTIDNVMYYERNIRLFNDFLRKIELPLANEFSVKFKGVEAILQQNIDERGHSFDFEIPIEEILNQWRTAKTDFLKIMGLTHSVKSDGGRLLIESQLNTAPDAKKSFVDLFSTNIKTDDFYTFSHQQNLEILAAIETATISEFLKSQELLLEYFTLISNEIQFISQTLGQYDDHLNEDTKFLISCIQALNCNKDMDYSIVNPLCYSASMLLCALSEKLLRLAYIHLTREERYVQSGEATIGTLLSTSNQVIVDILGEHHIKNLSFFLQQTGEKKIGHNLRNSLAHWSNIISNQLTITFAARLLWLFTDILNSVFLYYLKTTMEHEAE